LKNLLKNIITISLLSISTVSAIEIKELKEIPKSIERDFYIWQFLQDNHTTKEEAIEASKLIFRVNGKLNRAFEVKTGLHLPKKVYTPHKSHIEQYNILFQKIRQSKDFFSEWQKLSAKNQLIFFNLAGRTNRKLLNKKIDKTNYNNLTKHYAINEFIERSFKEDLSNIKETILNTKPITNNKITYKNLLKIGFENMRLHQEKLASYFFYNAAYKTKDRFHGDRALFWLYMATKDKKYLNKVANSYDYDIYKLIALDFLNKPYPKPKTEPLNPNLKPNIDITNPIEWAKLKRKIFSNNINLYNLAKKFASTETMAYYYYILYKASRYKNQYFPIPYKEILKKYPTDRQALLLAIARQESHFIPASISSSFAVGMMQFMPFLVKHIAKQRKENIKLEDMFNPRLSLEYANTHLNYLNKHLYNPLFVAYAYNAGIGYTRKLIRQNIFKKGDYEPYLSIELVGNEQANYYGKRVLANYVLYKMLLGSPIKITKIIDELTNPELTDRFRK